MKKDTKLFLEIQHLADLASFLLTTESQLIYNSRYNNQYIYFKIPKKSGQERQISSPTGEIARYQSLLMPCFCDLYNRWHCAHGFLKGRSILTNARNHIKKKIVINIDLAHFYDSIHMGRIKGLFEKPPFSFHPSVAKILAYICSLPHGQGLPQGACTSPILSNFIASAMDGKLTRFSRKHNLYYTRYADDLTFSTRKSTPPSELAISTPGKQFPWSPGPELEQIIQESGFEINHQKFRVQHKSSRQTVTGLLVNEKLNVKRSFIRNLRAMIHSWKNDGLVLAEKKHFSKSENLKGKVVPYGNGSAFRKRLYGYLAYLRMVRGPQNRTYQKFCDHLSKIDQTLPKFIIKDLTMKQNFDIFICHASEDKEEIAIPIHRECTALGISAFLDKKCISWGESFVEKINDALGRSRYVLAILSSKSINKEWPKKEIFITLSNDIKNGEKRILPLVVGNPDLSSLTLLKDIQYLKWRRNPKEISGELNKIINKSK